MKKETDEWFTPIHLLNLVQKFYEGEFLDPASNAIAQEYVKATWWYDRDRNGLNQNWLSQKWYGRVWLNPPYSYPLVEQFTSKLIAIASQVEGLCLVNNATETQWFQKLAAVSDRRLDIRGRLKFWHPEKNADSPRYGQVLFYLGNRLDEFDLIFGELGLLYSKPVLKSEQLKLF